MIIFSERFRRIIFAIFLLGIPMTIFSSEPRQLSVVIQGNNTWDDLYEGGISIKSGLKTYKQSIEISPPSKVQYINIKISSGKKVVIFKNCPVGENVNLTFRLMPNGNICILPFVKLPNTCQPTKSCI